MFILYYTWIYDRIPLISLKNILIMLEKSLYYALASNLIFMVPLFQSAIASRKKKVSAKDRAFSHGYDHIWNEARTHYNVWYYNLKETNFFARAPFNCLLCFTFWATLIGSCLIPLVLGGEVNPTPAFVAPVIAVAFKRWFDSLPIKF